MPILQLAPDVAAKIAAGEVVERPASVVKELIENSIDAGATHIRVELVGGGLSLIHVTDNGGGIPAGELPLALSRHATSKVASIDDLEHIRSLGFRGEALASIAAVADVTLTSRHREEQQGAQVSASNGHISEVMAAASPVGTTMTVRNLFSAVPARLKFLKSRTTEVSHCHHLLEQYALAYPEIRFSVSSEGRQIFATPGDGKISSVLVAIYGLEVAEQMIPVSSLDGRDEDPLRPVATGYISKPTCYKSTRQYMSFFVNRRWVMSRMLSASIEEAYKTLLLTGRHPIAVINIIIDPSQIDVNVHPAKTEIRFLRERRVYSAIVRAVRNAILEGAEMPQWGSASSTTPSSSHDDTSLMRDLPGDLPEDMPAESTNPTGHGNEAFPRDNPWLTVTEEETGTKPPLLSRLWQSHVRGQQALGTEILRFAQDDRTGFDDDMTGFDREHSLSGSTDTSDTSDTNPAHPNSPPRLSNTSDTSDTFAATGSIQASTSMSRLPILRVIGQLSQSYIVTEGPDGMYLVDQHAAHERILLERMVAALQARATLSQLLLTPLRLELAPVELEALEEHLEQLRGIGFTLEILEDGALEARAVPQALLKQINARSLRDLLVELTAPGFDGNNERNGGSQA
ncbi:MAG TPA: DNA mismatch repair endonuclease MutL, partial [Chthonomonadales bacterium]|nr:DNA mismatch repair endonuclease MutL [Chthonomonadales bacterium]